MSASVDGRTPSRDQDPSRAAILGVFDKLEGFVQATRHLEAALDQERRRNKKLQEELQHERSLHENILKDSEVRNRELTVQEAKLRAVFAEHVSNEKRLGELARALSEELKKTKAELHHYKAAWSGVLQREREAKMVLMESDRTSKRLAELESLNKKLSESLSQEKVLREQSERHSQSYQSELQNSLVRLHSSEARISELSKEYQLIQQTKKNFDDEIAKVETSMRERFTWALVKEKERIRAEVEKEAALERESFREQVRQAVRAELENELSSERERIMKRYVQMEMEVDRLRGELDKARDELDRLRMEPQGGALIAGPG